MFPPCSSTNIVMCEVSTILFSIELYLNRNSHLGKSHECWPGWYFHRYPWLFFKSKEPWIWGLQTFLPQFLCLLGDSCSLSSFGGLSTFSPAVCQWRSCGAWKAMGVIVHPFTFPLHPPCSSLTQNLCPHNKGSQLWNLQTPGKVLQSSLSSEKPNGASLWKCWPGELFVSCWKSCLVSTKALICGTFPSSLKWD